METHSNILAWGIPWTEEPGGLQSVASQRAGHDWRTKHTAQHPEHSTGLFIGIICQSWSTWHSLYQAVSQIWVCTKAKVLRVHGYLGWGGRALPQGNGKRGAKNAFPKAELVATTQAVRPVSQPPSHQQCEKNMCTAHIKLKTTQCLYHARKANRRCSTQGSKMQKNNVLEWIKLLSDRNKHFIDK